MEHAQKKLQFVTACGIYICYFWICMCTVAYSSSPHNIEGPRVILTLKKALNIRRINQKFRLPSVGYAELPFCKIAAASAVNRKLNAR
jgi:hypothetical protein